MSSQLCQVALLAIVPPNPTDSKFPQGSREYQFFRAAIKWLEGKRSGVLPGTFSKYLREAKRAASEENGMMNWSNLFDDRTPSESYKSVLNKVTNLMRDYAFSSEEGAFHQILHQTQNI